MTEEPQEYYLRVEAVNLSNFILDVQDLSTVRGGGLLLLELGRRLRDEANDSQSELHRFFLPIPEDLRAVSVGASSGLFRCKATESQEEELRRAVLRWLQSNPNYRHATFVVDIQKLSNDDRNSRNRVIVRNRLRQFRQPTVAVPEPLTPEGIAKLQDEITDPGLQRRLGNHGTFCAVDRVRPATEPTRRGEQPVLVSESVLRRREFGIRRKQNFYAEYTGLTGQWNFTQDFEDLTSLSAEDSQVPSSLNGKMAVIYLDGNKFGSIQANLGENNLRNWDKRLGDYRCGVLKDLLLLMQQEAQEQSPPENTQADTRWTHQGQYRIETLLWGGDEILWVVPAWQGWRVLSFFFKHSGKWTFDSKPLHHAAGLVFCHHNAPIQRIVQLAKKLCDDLAKEKKAAQAWGLATEPSLESMVAYEVLESFDFIGEDLLEHRQRYVLQDGQQENHAWRLCLPATKMDALNQASRTIRAAAQSGAFSTRQLHRIVGLMRAEPNCLNDETKINQEARRLIPDPDHPHSPAAQQALQDLANTLGRDRLITWVHLLRLWDYLPLDPMTVSGPQEH